MRRQLSFLMCLMVGACGQGAEDLDQLTEQGVDKIVLAVVAAEPTPEAREPPTVAPTQKILTVDYQVQSTGYWCGPAATRIALSARVTPPSQAALAAQLGTTVDGTNHIGLVTNVLNARLGTGWYETKQMPNDPPTAAQRTLLWNDIILDIDRNYPIVANIVAPPSNHPPGYPNVTIYHYFTIIGYDKATKRVYIADPANFSGYSKYWLSFDQVATLIPPKGYSA